MGKRLWDLAKSRFEIATILLGHRYIVYEPNLPGVKLPKSVRALFPSDPGTFCGIYGQPLLLHLISHRIWAPDRLPKRNQV